MIERRDRAGLTVEALAELRVGGEVRGQDLDRDRAIESYVERFVDFAHAARTERGLDFVWAEADAGMERHRLRFRGDYSSQMRDSRCCTP